MRKKINHSNVTEDIKAVVWLFLSFLVAASLFSYNPQDPSLNSLGGSGPPQNWCGYLGSFLADFFYQFCGLFAWGFVGLSLIVVTRYFRGSKEQGFLVQVLGVAGFMVLGAALMSLYFPDLRYYEGHVSLGGVVGAFITDLLLGGLNSFGVSLLLWALVVVNFLVVTDISFLDAWAKIKIPRIRIALPKVILPEISFPEINLQNLFRRKIKTVDNAPAQNLTFSAPTLKLSSAVEEEEEWEEDEEEGEECEEEASVRRRRVSAKSRGSRKIANWKLPDLNTLEDPPEERYRVGQREIDEKTKLLIDKFSQFSVKGEVKRAKPGPAVTLFEFKPEASVKISKITELADDLSLALSSESVRIIAPIPGRNVVGIETSNSKRETVYLKDIVADDNFWNEDISLPIALGREANGTPKVVDLRKMPHLLVAGTTGSGKSVFVVCLLTGLLFRHSPKSLRLILIDPKQVDLAVFSDVPHLLMPPICEPKKAVIALKWAVKEMEKRYRSMSKFGARGIEAFNEKVANLSKEEIQECEEENISLEDQRQVNQTYYYSHQPYIILVVEEFADLMAVDKANVEQLVVRLAQMARASGIHLILAMQSPRKDVVTGLIKTNIPGRISFKVASKMDSRIILDESGAERLLARGDMLFLAPGVAKPIRHHGPWVPEDEIAAVMEYWSDQAEPEYDERAMQAISGKNGNGAFQAGGFSGFEEEEEHDERYDEILAWVSAQKGVSASLIQRKFRLGYPRAARIIEYFEREGVVGPANGSKPRQVMVGSFESEA